MISHLLMKLSNAKSSDPVQQKLRDDKSIQNKDTSLFIHDLIHLKKTLNGTPSKFHPERIPIGEAFTPDVVSELDRLTQDFNSLAQGWKTVIDEQEQYSKNRRHKANPSAMPAVHASLNIEASNRVTRFLSKLKGPLFFDSPEQKRNKYRISLINQIENMYYLTKEVQAEIVETSPESLIHAKHDVDKLELEIDKLVNEYLQFAKVDQISKQKANSVPAPSLPADISHLPDPDHIWRAEKPPMKEEVKKTKRQSLEEWHKDLVDYNAATKLKDDFEKFMKYFDRLQNGEESKGAYLSCERLYQKMLSDAKDANNFTNATSLKDITEAKMNKTAGIISKWINKMKHKLNISDPTSSARLAVYDVCENLKHLLDSFLDVLDSELNLLAVEKFTGKLKEFIEELQDAMSPFNSVSPEYVERLRRSRTNKRVREQVKHLH